MWEMYFNIVIVDVRYDAPAAHIFALSECIAFFNKVWRQANQLPVICYVLTMAQVKKYTNQRVSEESVPKWLIRGHWHSYNVLFFCNAIAMSKLRIVWTKKCTVICEDKWRKKYSKFENLKSLVVVFVGGNKSEFISAVQ